GPMHQHETTESQTTTRQLEARYPSLQIRGFGDVDFSTTDQRGAISGFNLGQLDLHLASALSHKVTYFGEMTFNAQPTGYTVQMGVSVYRDKITLPIVSPAGNEFREWISAAHIVWTKETPEFLAEFANVNHKNILTNATTNNQAYYVQVGYRLPWLEKTLKPYY